VGEEARPQDEMRPITALCVDIVGSTGLGERLGPDEVKALVGECVTQFACLPALDRIALAPGSE
jgi:class 3 adenylate cyclase